MRGFRHWRWHLDVIYLKLKGEMVYLCRGVDHEGEVPESYVIRTRDKAAALRFMKRALKRHNSPEAITTDGLRSYGAAMDELGNREKQEVGCWANAAWKTHTCIPATRAGYAQFAADEDLQKVASVHANVHNFFSLERRVIDRQTYKKRRSAARAEWQVLAS